MPDLDDLSEKTRATYAERLATLTLPKDGSPGELDAFRAHLRERCDAAPTGTALPTAAAAFHYLVETLGLDEHDARRYLPPIRRSETKARPEATDEQRAALTAQLAIEPLTSARFAILVISASGLRVSEAVELRAGAVERSHDPAILLLDIVGKRKKRRSVPVGGRAAVEITRRIDGLPESAFVFPGRDPGTHIHPVAIRGELGRMVARDPTLGPRLTPHTLRHWYGNRALENDVDLLTLQSLLGHASPETTRIYARPSTRKLVSAAKKLG